MILEKQENEGYSLPDYGPKVLSLNKLVLSLIPNLLKALVSSHYCFTLNSTLNQCNRNKNALDSQIYIM